MHTYIYELTKIYENYTKINKRDEHICIYSRGIINGAAKKKNLK